MTKEHSHSETNQKILISGASGFLGQNLLKHSEFLRSRAVPVTRQGFQINNDFGSAEAALHIAGLAHQSYHEYDKDLYYKSNVELSLDFLRKAADKGVKHFILVSTAKVFGEGGNLPYTESSPIHPQDIYARSKAIAEEKCSQLADERNLKLTILRPPLIYGPNPKANFLTIWNAIAKGYPIPVSSLSNLRSIISTYNFADFLERLLSNSFHEKISLNFLPSLVLLQDPKPISTEELVHSIVKAQERPNRIIKIPHGMGTWGARILGKADLWDKWTGSFFYENSSSLASSKWTPKFTTEQSLQFMAYPRK